MTARSNKKDAAVDEAVETVARIPKTCFVCSLEDTEPFDSIFVGQVVFKMVGDGSMNPVSSSPYPNGDSVAGYHPLDTDQDGFVDVHISCRDAAQEQEKAT